LNGLISSNRKTLHFPQPAALERLSRTTTTTEGKHTMEMHLQQSLHEARRIGVIRARLRRRSDAGLGFAQVVAFLKAALAAVQAELAARRAIAQLASMNDHQLRDIGISRYEIESAVRGLQNVATADEFAREARVSSRQ